MTVKNLAWNLTVLSFYEILMYIHKALLNFDASYVYKIGRKIVPYKFCSWPAGLAETGCRRISL
jgi:hypothetical protein